MILKRVVTKSSCAYFKSNPEKFEHVPGVDLTTGFTCPTCHASSKDERKVNHFSDCSNEAKTLEKSEIQYLSFDSGSYPIAVLKDLTAEQQEIELLASRMLEEDEGESSAEEEDGELASPTTQFYRKLGWFSKESKISYPFEEIARVKENMDQALLTKFREYFEFAIKKVPCLPLDKRNLILDRKKFGIAVIDDSGNQYSKCFACFFGFLESLCRNEFFSRSLPVEVKEMVTRMASCRNPIADFDAIAPIWQYCAKEALPHGGEDFFKLFIMFEALIQNRDEKGKQEAPSYLPAAEIERLSAKLMYMCRLYFVMLMHNSTSENWEEVKQEAKTAFMNQDNPMLRLAALKSRSERFKRNDISNVRILPSDDGITVRFGSGELNPEVVHSTILSLTKKLEDEFNYLLFGYDFRLIPVELSEDMQCTANRWGCLGSLKDSLKIIYRRILSNEALKKDIVVEVCEGRNNVIWKSDFIATYNKRYIDALELFIALIHLTSGMPGRGTELTGLKMRNSGGKRNLYLINGRFAFHCTENKNCNKKDSDSTIFRFLPGRFTKHFAVFFGIIKRFNAKLQLQLTKNKSGYRRNLTYLYAVGGNKITARAYRKAFVSVTSREYGFKVGFQDFRHLVKGWAKRLLNTETRHIAISTCFGQANDYEDEAGEGGVDLIEDLQAGHSTKTAVMLYGFFNGDIVARQFIIEEFQKISLEWHRVLGVGDLDEASVVCSKIKGKGNEAAVIDETQQESYEVSVKVSDKIALRQDLKMLMNFDEFKSYEQEYSLQLILRTSVDVLSILPTGGGKSLLFALYALKKRAEEFTLNVIPTIVLKLQLYTELTKLKLKVTCTFNEQINCVEVAVVTPDQLTLSENVARIKRMAGKRLKRIFVDEAHCAVLDCDYRQSYVDLKFIAELNVALTFTTATLSLGNERELRSVFQRPDSRFVTVRASVNCPTLDLRLTRNGSVQMIPSRIGSFFENFKPQERAIIFVNSHEMVRIVTDILSQESYLVNGVRRQCGELIACVKGGMLTDAIVTEVRNWTSGRRPIMVATTAFSFGINYPDVSMVINFGLPFTIEDFVQRIGRAGRAGRKAIAELILPPFEENKKASEDMKLFAKNWSECQRSFVARRIDNRMYDCQSSGSIFCEICKPLLGAESSHLVVPLPVATASPPVPSSQEQVFVPSVAESDFLDASLSAKLHVETPVATAPESLDEFKKRLYHHLERFVGYCVKCAFLDKRRVAHQSRSNCSYEKTCDRCFRTAAEHGVDPNEWHNLSHRCKYRWPTIFPVANMFLNRCCYLTKDGRSHREQNNPLSFCHYADILQGFISSEYFFKRENNRSLERDVSELLNNLENGKRLLWTKFVSYSLETVFDDEKSDYLQY